MVTRSPGPGKGSSIFNLVPFTGQSIRTVSRSNGLPADQGRKEAHAIGARRATQLQGRDKRSSAINVHNIIRVAEWSPDQRTQSNPPPRPCSSLAATAVEITGRWLVFPGTKGGSIIKVDPSRGCSTERLLPSTHGLPPVFRISTTYGPWIPRQRQPPHRMVPGSLDNQSQSQDSDRARSHV